MADSKTDWQKSNRKRAASFRNAPSDGPRKPGGVKAGPPRPGHKPYEDEPGWNSKKGKSKPRKKSDSYYPKKGEPGYRGLGQMPSSLNARGKAEPKPH